MNGEEYRFRSATFGFNRKDVIGYLEKVHQSYGAKIKALEKELEGERAARSDEARKGSLAGQEAAAAGEDAQRAKESMQEAVTALDDVRRERDELRLRLQAKEQELSELQEAAARMAPAARAYEALKEKTAGIELAAHSRAEEIVREGQRQADQTHREVERWLKTVESSYTRLKSDVAATLSHAIGELERTGQSLNGVTEELEGHGIAFHAIAHSPDNVPGEPPENAQ